MGFKLALCALHAMGDPSHALQAFRPPSASFADFELQLVAGASKLTLS